MAADLADALHACAAWHGTPEVVVTRSDPPEFTAMLTSALQQISNSQRVDPGREIG
jgi:hypothetical protein